MRRSSQSGFTLLELMVVVAVVAVLAVMVMPSWARESRKARYDSEVSAVFAELSAKEDMYKLEKFKYHAAAQCPAATADLGVPVSTCTTGVDWGSTKLRAAPAVKYLRCTYQVVTGCPADIAGPPAGIVFNQGVASWYFIVAVCGTGTDTYTYFTGSTNTRVQKKTGTVAFTSLANCSI
jgi:prepilin-type N-terminal cleavage/methylation domain-containing protein